MLQVNTQTSNNNGISIRLVRNKENKLLETWLKWLIYKNIRR